MGANSFYGQGKGAHLVLLKACDLQREKENFRKPKDSRSAQADKSLLVALPVCRQLSLCKIERLKHPHRHYGRNGVKPPSPGGAGRQGWRRGLSFVLVTTALSFTLPFIY